MRKFKILAVIGVLIVAVATAMVPVSRHLAENKRALRLERQADWIARAAVLPAPPPRRTIATEDNGFPVFLEIDELYKEIIPEMAEPYQEYLTAMAMGDSDWEPESIAEALALMEGLREPVNQLLKATEFQFPESKIDEDLEYLTTVNHLGSMYLPLVARSMFHDGRTREGLKYLVVSAALFDRMLAGEGYVIHLLVGITARTNVQKALASALIDFSEYFSKEDLLYLLGNLHETNPEVIYEMLAREKAASVEMVTRLLLYEGEDTKKAAEGMNFGAQFNGLDFEISTRDTQRFIDKFDLSRFTSVNQAAAQFYSRAIDYPKHDPGVPFAASFGELSDLRSITWLDPVELAEYSVLGTATLFGRILQNYHCLTARDRLLRTLVAISAARLDGSNFIDLDDLVPTYLDAVPIDPFDAAPLKYEPATETIYSIGDDRHDDGGEQFTPGLFADSSEIAIRLRDE